MFGGGSPWLQAAALLLAAARPAGAHTVDECVARVQFADRGGSATCIDARGYLLTCEHVTHGARQGSATFPDGGSYRVAVVAEDQARDLALAKFDAPAGQVSTRVADRLPDPQAELCGVGYPDGKFAVHHGPYLGEQSGKPEFLRANFSIWHGDSGGGVFGPDGRLVGVMESFESDDPRRLCNAVSVVEVAGFIGLSWGNPPAPWSGCPNGTCPTPPRYAQPQPAPPSAPLIPPTSGTPPPAPPVMPQAPDAALGDLKAQIADLSALVKAIKPVPGPPGKDGQDGKPGPQGPSGPPGKDADPAGVAALQAQQQQLQARVQSLETQLQNLSGSVRIQVQPK